MNVYFYKSFGKRNNSTKRPSITDTTKFTVHDCKLKQNCSEHDPVFILSSNEFGYVYAYAVDWHKFYYTVDVISLANGLVEYHMAEDLLASFQGNILGTTARILYSSTGYDTMIPDPRLKLENKRSGNHAAYLSNPVFSNTYGYIVTVFNTAGNMASAGATVSYLLSESGMDLFRGWLGNSGVTAAITQAVNGRLNDAIISCVWIPYFNEIVASGSVTGRTQMVVGNRYSYDDDHVYFNIGTCYSIDTRLVLSNVITFSTNLRYTDFRAYEPYTFGAIYLPGVGTISLSKNEWRGSNINVYVYIEAITGDVKYCLKDDSGNIISECNCNVSARCGLGEVVNNGGGIMTGIGSAAAGVATLAAGAVTGGSGAIIAGGALATLAGIANTILSANQHSASVSGGNTSTLASKNPDIRYYEISVDTEDPDDANYIALNGRPYKGVNLISNLVPNPVVPIYVQTVDGRVNPSVTDANLGSGVVTNATLREQGEINDFLNSGIYVE